MFRATYELPRKEVLPLLLDRRECLISNSPPRRSNPLSQPGIPAFGRAPHEARKWTGNPGALGIEVTNALVRLQETDGWALMRQLLFKAEGLDLVALSEKKKTK